MPRGPSVHILILFMNSNGTILFQECLHESFRNSLPLHSIVVEEDRTSIENSGSSGSYNIVTVDGNWGFYVIVDR